MAVIEPSYRISPDSLRLSLGDTALRPSARIPTAIDSARNRRIGFVLQSADGVATLVAPEEMQKGVEVIAMLSVQEQQAAPRPVPKGARISKKGVRLTKTMSGRLTGDGFEIRPQSDTVQPIVQGQPTIWIYGVKPMSGGEHTLTGIVAQRIDSGAGHVFTNSLEPATLMVTVRVSRMNEIADYFRGHPDEVWKWVTGGGLATTVATVGGWFGVKRSRKRKKPRAS